ncbi:hypothetical protein VIBNIENn2_750019 [Vibrio nigripulchritudo ENn2]|nr:hypothetical protein VIBNIENn2_750019 [Vibrio nigripulchritudo ENn2]
MTSTAAVRKEGTTVSSKPAVSRPNNEERKRTFHISSSEWAQ